MQAINTNQGALFPLDVCQRWTERREAWQPDTGERFTGRGYVVHPINDDSTARTFIERHHYSGAYVCALYRFGLFYGPRLVGVAVYSAPLPGVLTCVLPDLDPFRESVELGRFVLLDEVPGNAESWFLARCHERLIAAGVAGVVSFSDPVPRRLPSGVLITPGHIGVIYQATNAIYTGRAGPRTLWVLPDGTIFNEQAQGKIRQQKRGHAYAERQLIAWGARPMVAGEDPKAWLAEARLSCRITLFRHPGNHRYVFPLGRNARARARVRIALPGQPYPKTREIRELMAS